MSGISPRRGDIYGMKERNRPTPVTDAAAAPGRSKVHALVDHMREHLAALEEDEAYEQCAEVRDGIERLGRYVLGYCEYADVVAHLMMFLDLYGHVVATADDDPNFWATWYTPAVEDGQAWEILVSREVYRELTALLDEREAARRTRGARRR